MEAKRTKGAPIREQQMKARRRSSSGTNREHRHDQRANKSTTTNQSKMMIYSTLLALLVSLFALGANASLFSFAFSSSKSEQPQTTTPATSAISTPATTEKINKNHQDLNSSQSVGDLVAIGAISLLDSPQTAAKQASLSAELLAENGGQQQQQQKNKLDYIIDFMRANKLAKFCDLITSQEAPVRRLNRQLNELAQFTLFVPTNEALLLMASGQLEQIKRQPELLGQFVGAHATDELVVPRSGMSGLRPTSLLSLSGGHLRVVSVAPPPPPPPPPANNWPISGGANGTKLELVVNGATVLSGNSYALQEPNNNKATYAIVHLIDRVLYPMPTGRLVDKVRSLAPKMARYFELAASSDRQLREALAPATIDSGSLWTLFLPTDDAFEATPVKLLDQLESNRTFLIEFLRGHLIDGLYFSSQLSALAPSAAGGHQQRPSASKLVSLSGKSLDIETKPVQARTLVLINSTPLLEPDLMALNGVVHLVSRPILERHLADDCNCASSPDSSSQQTAATGGSNNRAWPPEGLASNKILSQARANVVTYEVDNRAAASSPTNWAAARRPAAAAQQESSSIQYASESGNHLSNAELEREESRTSDQRIRSQRSGSLLVERNNRDFYRPSTAPANLLADERPLLGQLEDQSSVNRQTIGVGAVIGGTNAALGRKDLLDGVDVYKIVLNATTRQRLREMQRADDNRFAYDRPLMIGSSTPAATDLGDQNSAATPSSFLLRRPYTPTPRSGADTVQATIAQNHSTSNLLQDQLALSSVSHSQQQQQQMIKFQPEDARDTTNAAAAATNSRFSSSFARNTLLQAASGDQSSTGRQEQLTSKTVAPPGIKSSIQNCAFYDADCRRLSGKLVRLPPLRNRLAQQTSDGGQQMAKSTLMHASSSNHTFVRTGAPLRSDLQPNLDSTFGETDTSFNHNNGSQQQQQLSRAQQAQRPTLTPARVSPLNQPLPPWSSDEELQHRGIKWRAPTTGGGLDPVGSDLARLKGPAYGFTGGISRAQPTPPLANGVQLNSGETNRQPAEILLLPVKIIREGSDNRNLSSQQQQASSFIERPQQTPGPFLANRQFHTPTPYSVSTMTTHVPPMFVASNTNNQHLGRLTNFTALEFAPEEAAPQGQQQPTSNNNNQVRFETSHTISRPQQPLKSPSAFRRQRIQQQQQTNAGLLESPKQVGRKVVLIQQQQAEPQLDESGGDVSITSAKLTNNQLATQASNVSTNFVRSVAIPPTTSASAVSLSGGSDFFQDRTIAEIMDDSGLRIDGQQVTFSRLKECLQEAKLLNLVTQSDNSLTIFMPTDLAFQRLVQQQALLHQQRQRESRNSRQSPLVSSLASSGGDQRQVLLLPLMARANRATGSQPLLAASDSLDQLDGSMASVGDRLTLDCGSQQVRKLLLDHLSTRLVQPKQLTLDTSITSLNGHQLLLSSVPSKKIVVVDGQPVIAATRAKNGMVYVVNKFLNLTNQMPNVLELMESQPNLTTFLSYLSFSSMSDRLKREIGPLTILAPTNEAFEQLTPAARQLINSDPAALADILRGHIVEGAQFGKLIPMRSQLKTMNSDQSIEAKVIKPNVYLLDNQMTSMRLVGTTGNGVVNAIDRLIVPAWLKVSMGSPRSAAGGSASAALEVMEASLPGTRLRSSQVQPSANLNLPTITNQPLTFEQPTNRLSAPSGRDSFLLDSSSSLNLNSNSNANDNTNNLLSDFDLPPQSGAAEARQSPFARLPNGLETTRVNPSNLTTAPTTKNMLLIEKLSQLMQARKFVKYLSRSGVSEKLKPDMNYVILVPTDQAIEKLPKQIIELLERDRDRLADLINYHVLDTTFEYINTIPDGQTLNTLNEKDILFNWHRNNTILTASGAVVMGGIQEENIALLIVDRVLYPTPGDILNIISKSPILSNFTSLVRNAGLEKQLSSAGPFTLFAPSDFAFNQLTKSDMDLLRRNKDTARRFLLRHLSQPAVFTSSIALSNSTSSATNLPISTRQQQNVPHMTISNLIGEELTLRQRNDYFSVNEVNFSYADVAATNGVVHVIDGLL